MNIIVENKNSNVNTLIDKLSIYFCTSFFYYIYHPLYYYTIKGTYNSYGVN